MAQLNVEIDEALLKRVKMACVEDGTSLKKWVSAALELALDFDTVAANLGWTPPAPEDTSQPFKHEIIEGEGPPPSKAKRVQKTQ